MPDRVSCLAVDPDLRAVALDVSEVSKGQDAVMGEGASPRRAEPSNLSGTAAP